MNPKQERFCEEYIIDLNATQAAKRAGYSEKTANEQGSQLLAILSIQERIQELIKERSEKTKITAERVLEELALIGFSDITDLIEIEENGLIIAKRFEDMPKGASRLLKAVKEDRIIREVSRPGSKTEEMVVHDKVKYEIWDKMKALEMIGRHLVMFTDKSILDANVIYKIIYDAKVKANNADTNG